MFENWKLIVGVLTVVVMLANFVLSIWTLIHTSSKKRIEDIRAAFGEGDAVLKKQLETFESVNQRRIAFVTRQHTHFDRRIAVLEEQMRNAPTHADLAKIEDAVADLRADVAGNTARTEATYNLVSSIQKFLLERKS